MPWPRSLNLAATPAARNRGGSREHPFGLEGAWRPLVVALDADLAAAVREAGRGSPPGAVVEELLGRLLARDEVATIAMSDPEQPCRNGAAAEAAALASRYPGWAGLTFCAFDAVTDQLPFVVAEPDGRTTYSSVLFAAGNDRDLLVRAAHEAGADLLVSRRTTGSSSAGNSRVTAGQVNPAEAITVIGACLRSRAARFAVSPDAYPFGRRMTEWVLARELLPASWPLFSAAVFSSQARGDETTRRLSESAILRLARMFAPRDNMRRLSLMPANNDIIEESLAELDHLLMSAVGAFDALARLSHVLAGLDGSRRNAAWQHDKWVRKLSVAGPAFSDLVRLADPSGAMMRATGVLRLLRNSVHGESPQGLRHQAAGQTRGLIALPADEAQSLHDAIEGLGGPGAWGIEEIGGGTLVLEPGRFADRVVPVVAEHLDCLMASVPISQFQGVASSQVQTGPPTTSPFTPRERAELRLLYGF